MSARLDSYGDDLAGLRNRALLLLVQASGLAPADVAVLDHEEASPRASSIPALHPDGFDGPMGVLVELAERRRIDLGRMSVRDLVEQFTSAMTWLAGRVAIERQADRKPSLRSRMRPWKSRSCRSGFGCGRGRPGPAARTESTTALMEACLVVLRGPNSRPEAAPVYRPGLVRMWRVDQALARMRQPLAEDPEGKELGHFMPAGPGADELSWARRRGRTARSWPAWNCPG